MVSCREQILFEGRRMRGGGGGVGKGLNKDGQWMRGSDSVRVLWDVFPAAFQQWLGLCADQFETRIPRAFDPLPCRGGGNGGIWRYIYLLWRGSLEDLVSWESWQHGRKIPWWPRELETKCCIGWRPRKSTGSGRSGGCWKPTGSFAPNHPAGNPRFLDQVGERENVFCRLYGSMTVLETDLTMASVDASTPLCFCTNHIDGCSANSRYWRHNGERIVLRLRTLQKSWVFCTRWTASQTRT